MVWMDRCIALFRTELQIASQQVLMDMKPIKEHNRQATTVWSHS